MQVGILIRNINFCEIPRELLFFFCIRKNIIFYLIYKKEYIM